MSEIITYLAGILVTLIIILVALVIIKKKRSGDATRFQDPRVYPNYQQPEKVPYHQSMTVPRKSRFQVPASVRSIESTPRKSFIIGVEVGSADKLQLNQPVAILGEEVVQEKIERVETATYHKEKDPELMDKLQELISLVKNQKPIELDHKIKKETTPEIPEEPDGHLVPKKEPVSHSVPKVKKTGKKSKKEPGKKSWHQLNPWKETECSVCHVTRKTRWKPKEPGEKYVCFECKAKEEGGDNGQ